MKKIDKKIMGYKSNIKGLHFENKVANYFSKNGWNVSLRKTNIIPPFEIDVFGIKEIPYIQYLLVECKDKEMVTNKDVNRFINKVDEFKKRHGYSPMLHNVFAVIAYTNEVDEDAKKVAQKHGIQFLSLQEIERNFKK